MRFLIGERELTIDDIARLGVYIIYEIAQGCEPANFLFYISDDRYIVRES